MGIYILILIRGKLGKNLNALLTSQMQYKHMSIYIKEEADFPAIKTLKELDQNDGSLFVNTLFSNSIATFIRSKL